MFLKDIIETRDLFPLLTLASHFQVQIKKAFFYSLQDFLVLSKGFISERLNRGKFKKKRVLGFYSGNLRKRVKVHNLQNIHLDRVSNQSIHPKFLGCHNHLG